MGLQELINMDNNFKDYIKSNEGYNPNIYEDTKKIPTTGYGFNIKSDHVRKLIPTDVISGKRALTPVESDLIFKQLYTTAVSDAEKYVGQPVFDKMPVNAKKALIDVSYNLGLTKLNKFEKMKKALISGDYDTAGKELLDSKYAKKDVPDRANRNYELITGKKRKTLSNLYSGGK